MIIRPCGLALCAAALAVGGSTNGNHDHYPCGARAAGAASETQGAGKAKNVILFIADGNGVGTNCAIRLLPARRRAAWAMTTCCPRKPFPIWRS